MLSEVSVYEVFMHYSEKMSSASAPGLRRGTSILQTISLPSPGKNPAGTRESVGLM